MKKYLPFLILITTFIASNSKVKGQVPCPQFPNAIALPKMFVDTSNGKMRTQEFKKARFLKSSKYKILERACKNQDTSFFYKYSALEKLLNTFVTDNFSDSGVRLSIVRFNDKMKPASFPSVKNNEIIFLFSSVFNKSSTPTKYYFIQDKTGLLCEVPINDATNWIKNYEHVLKKLKRTVNKRDSSNKMNNKLSDTRSIYYPRLNLYTAIINEYNYQKKFHPDTTLAGLKAVFSAYTKNGRDNTEEEPNNYKGRLLVQFNYMFKNAQNQLVPLSLEEQPEYACRLKLLLQSETNFTGETYLNNGKLCPPHCP